MFNKPHILIVEDNPDHRELLEDTFKTSYKVSHADSKEKSLSLINEHKYDLIVLDYYLKNKFSGLEILKEITENHPQIPVIMVTAYGNEDVAVDALKSGARDYIRKTLDNTFIKRIAHNINEILKHKQEFVSHEKQSLLDFFVSHEKEFSKAWYNNISSLKKRLGLSKEISVTQELLNNVFATFLADIQNEKASVTLNVLKKMIWTQTSKMGSLILVELLNKSFKEVTRELLSTYFPASFEERSVFMKRVSALVDENDLELSKEYERIIDTSTEKMLEAERLSTKLLVMRTLQHEIRQPLSYIYNSIELVLNEEHDHPNKQVLTTILEQAQKIDKLLTTLEKDSQMPLKDYADKLPMIDISVDKG
ncbi:MAG: response regulator [Spirochaetales bacterium]|nr:response regulator [Spirochaetales bacterium]